MIFLFGRLAIMLLIILALARPRLSDTIRESKTEIVDILLVIDQSSSMLAQDFKPNRLEAAKAVAKKFIKDREGDRLGLIVFAGESYIQCPLTRDIDVLLEFTEEIEIIDREHDGTAIGMALAMGINRLRDSEVENKVLVLLSDGSNNAGELDPLTAARMATDYGITIHTIGIGREGKVPYPAINPFTGRKMLDYREMEMDEETLSDIAETTTGYYSRASDRVGLSSIFDELDKDDSGFLELPESPFVTLLFQDRNPAGESGAEKAIVFDDLKPGEAMTGTAIFGDATDPEQLAEFYEAADTDGDGRISFREYYNWQRVQLAELGIEFSSVLKIQQPSEN